MLKEWAKMCWVVSRTGLLSSTASVLMFSSLVFTSHLLDLQDVLLISYAKQFSSVYCVLAAHSGVFLRVMY